MEKGSNIEVVRIQLLEEEQKLLPNLCKNLFFVGGGVAIVLLLLLRLMGKYVVMLI